MNWFHIINNFFSSDCSSWPFRFFSPPEKSYFESYFDLSDIEEQFGWQVKGKLNYFFVVTNTNWEENLIKLHKIVLLDCFIFHLFFHFWLTVLALPQWVGTSSILPAILSTYNIHNSHRQLKNRCGNRMVLLQETRRNPDVKDKTSLSLPFPFSFHEPFWACPTCPAITTFELNH